MVLSKLNEMSVGPLWALRARPLVDPGSAEANCPVCGAAWLESVAQDPEVLIVLADPLADPDQQTLLDNCIRAAGWADVASRLTLHTACATDAGIRALERQLAATPVELVVVFGEGAAQSIKPEFKRGAIQPYHRNGLIVTHHPSQMLATPALKYQTWSDLCMARFED